MSSERGLCEHVRMPSAKRTLSWPDAAPPLPVEPLRPVIERLTSLALRHGEDIRLREPLVDDDGERDPAADLPPSLELVAEAFGGIIPIAGGGLDLLVDERIDLGPYTMLGSPVTYVPLHEGEDVAVILTLDEDGAPGAVYGIGEDLSLTLAARDLQGFLERYADALEAALAGLEALGDGASRTEREELLEARMQELLWDAVLGRGEDRAEAVIQTVDGAELSPPVGLPAGTLGVADLRHAESDMTVPVMDADLPGDPLATRIGWSAGGLLISLTDERTGPDRTSSDPMGPDRTSPDRTSPDRTNPDPTTTEELA